MNELEMKLKAEEVKDYILHNNVESNADLWYLQGYWEGLIDRDYGDPINESPLVLEHYHRGLEDGRGDRERIEWD